MCDGETYLDTVQVGFLTSLEIGMLKFPYILLDLTCVLVRVFDLEDQHGIPQVI